MTGCRGQDCTGRQEGFKMFEAFRDEFSSIMKHFFETEIVINDKRGDTKAVLPLIVFTLITAMIIRISLRLFALICVIFTCRNVHCFLRKHTGEMIDVSPSEIFRIITEAVLK